MFVALVIVALEPYRYTIWRFEPSSIARKIRWPIYGHTRVWDVLRLSRLELRYGGHVDRGIERLSNAPTNLSGETPFGLAFVSADNIDVCEIGNLTEGEARWIARVVLERRASWFGKL